jgi:FAD/FMN-containing dehydrogenase/Fe-S oxidoreductase
MHLKNFQGEVRFDHLSKLLYATDASAYREIPEGVVIPENIDDLHAVIKYARQKKLSVIPRGAGTSLAGQVVGSGIVIDVSKYLNKILEVNPTEKWVRVEPGVVLSELNLELQKHGLMFGPETSTANRCTMGGMLGNNSCGLHSLVHGSVREHILGVNAILSDGSEVVFKSLTAREYDEKLELPGLEGELYRQIDGMLRNKSNRKAIADNFPHPEVPRRNNGYALDILAQMQPFNPDGEPFNFAKLIAGSEGTLALVTELKLNLIELPPREKALMCVHFEELEQAFKANLIALKYRPSAIELMDKTIMDMTKKSIGLQKNRFFLKGEPEAILIIELWADELSEIEESARAIEKDMRDKGFGYYFPLIRGEKIPLVWNLRKAGLGVLSNLPGDAKPVSVVEDTAIPVKKLPAFLKEFKHLLEALELRAVYHAHIATGELHLRPVLNLKDTRDVGLFRKVAIETAKLVKKYRGSLSGEHGDGRLRGEFIPFMLGNKVYQLLVDLKKVWDPENLFNPGKITDTPPMHDFLRYEPGAETPELNSYFAYKESLGMARAIEKCNGSGDCRKSEIIGGTLCPSFMATREEMHSTRGRANVLRELITRPSEMHWADQKEVLLSLDLCLSCKACKSECPSGVDIAKLKADFLQNYYDGNPLPFRSWLIGNFPYLMEIAAHLNPVSNMVMKFRPSAAIIKYLSGFSQKRPLPRISKQTLKKWNRKRALVKSAERKVYLFNDEFLNINDAHIGISAILLLERLGYEVIIPKHVVSGRTYLSKGMVKKARKVANQNVELLKNMITENTPLIGIEPSAILSFRDEYPELVKDELQKDAVDLSENALMFEEFFMREVKAGRILKDSFVKESKMIRLHGHCHQKALVTTKASVEMLSFPENYVVKEIPSGCCGMAGSFGYEKEHYEISMKIGELVLFPEVRKTDNEHLIAAPGTSCREQIAQGTGRHALHPVEIIYNALK